MDHDHEIALIRGVFVLSLVLILISTVFKLGMALGWQAAADDLQWSGSHSGRPEWEPCSAEKRRGVWEVHSHEGMTIVMPGVCWLQGSHSGRPEWSPRMREARRTSGKENPAD